uniref:Glycoside hydrolase family 19 catalytic domain-containing protein n=1 Tax=Picea sitchensis TaxID=3332 RepID=A9NXF9_PICSI|nr:unknown [Picea sitchensis]
MASATIGRMKSMRVLSALTALAMMGTLCCQVSAQQGVASIISEDVFNQFLKHRNDDACPAKGFYTYSAFIAAANSFPDFGNNGDLETSKRELAAFFGQTSQETTGGWATAPDGPYAWGYCFKEENSTDRYHGRGPIQLTGDYNYKAAGDALGYDLINNPELVVTDATVSFKTAVWFWMTPQSPKPSCHDVILGRWSPSDTDTAAGRVPGYGMVTNIINGGVECGQGTSSATQQGRIGFYQTFCNKLGVDSGSNLDCNNQKHFGN